MTEQKVSYTLDSSLETIDNAEEKATRIATDLGFGDEEVMQISMSVREAAVNAVLHGNAYSPDKKVTLSFEHETAAVHRLAGFGDQVEVLGPPSVRARLVATAREILGRYHPAG